MRKCPRWDLDITKFGKLQQKAKKKGKERVCDIQKKTESSRNNVYDK